MRETWTTLQTQAHEATQTASSDTTINTFLENWINRGYKFVQAELDNYTTHVVRTASTVASQQFYHKPPDVVTIESIAITINSIDYVLEPLGSTRHWDELNAVTFSGTAIPTVFFQRRDDFGVWPIPQDAYTMTMSFIPRFRDMSIDDFTTGTVTVTNGDATLTHSATGFTAAMVGRWFKTTDDGQWYRVASFTDTANMELENVFQSTTAAGANFTIGESPEIPEELHEILAYRAAQMYFMQKRNDLKSASIWGNMFFTGDPQNSSRRIRDAAGGLLGAKKRYSARASTGIIRHRRRLRGDIFLEKAFATTIS